MIGIILSCGVLSFRKTVGIPSVHFVLREGHWGSRRTRQWWLGESLCTVVAAALCVLTRIRLGKWCVLASSVDLEQHYAAYVRMCVRLDSSYEPANSEDRGRRCRAVVRKTVSQKCTLN